MEFKGGSQWTVPAVRGVTATNLEQIVTNNGGVNASATEVKPFHGARVDGTTSFWQVQSGQLPTAKALTIGTDIARAYKLPVGDVPVTTVGASWGSQVTQKAVEALIAFLVVIVIYLSIAFEWRMAAAAFVALAHDIVITIGVYALTGFQVSPATVIGLLTILGYSLYDTVVVFDKVRENTAPILGTRKSTYSEAANLALNQTLVRSINTSLTALLPVAAILVVGTLLLGNGELKDLSLVLFVGMLSGTYSSIFIATPVLADLKEREPQYKQLAKQVALRAAGGRSACARPGRAPRPAGRQAPAGLAARRPWACPAPVMAEPALRRACLTATRAPMRISRPATSLTTMRPCPRPRPPAARRAVRPHGRLARVSSRSEGRPPNGVRAARRSAASDEGDGRRGRPRRRNRAAGLADPRRTRLSQARHRLQGHHSAAG